MYVVRIFSTTYWGCGHWTETAEYIPSHFDKFEEAMGYVKRNCDNEPQYYYEMREVNGKIHFYHRPESHKEIESYIEYERSVERVNFCRHCGHRI